MSSKEVILGRINKALLVKSEFSYEESINDETVDMKIDALALKDKDALWKKFKEEFEAIAGQIQTVNNIKDCAVVVKKFMQENNLNRVGISGEEMCVEIAGMIRKENAGIKIISPKGLNHNERKKEFANTEIAIVNPVMAVADIGSLVFQFKNTGTTLPHFLCDNVFAIIDQNNIVYSQFELFEKIDFWEAKDMFFAAGPSRTADIEKVLVLGAHGPRRLQVLVVKES